MLSVGGSCSFYVPFCPSCTRFIRANGSGSHPSAAKSVESAAFPSLHSKFGRELALEISRHSSIVVRATPSDENSDPPSNVTTTSESERDELTAKLAAAEAEAEVLKRELEIRRSSKDVDLSKLKIPTPKQRIDGTGYRERMFSGTGKKPEKKWGITEAELFMSKGAPSEGSGWGGPAMEDDASATVARRLLIGLGVTAAALVLAFVKLPVTLFKPSKPLFFYLKYILRLKDELEVLLNTVPDAKSLERRLKVAIGSREELKDNFLSAAALLEGEDADKASQLAFDIFQYLNQADYNKYFESLADPTSSQQVEYLKFSLQSIDAARLKMLKFLTFAPREDLQAAKMLVTQ